MTVFRDGGNVPPLIEVLDRVLDKGIVIDAWVRVSLAGIDFVTLEARAVVACIETYLNHAGALAHRNLAAAPPTISSDGHELPLKESTYHADRRRALTAKAGSEQ